MHCYKTSLPLKVQQAVRVLSGVETAERQVAEIQVEFPVGSAATQEGRQRDAGGSEDEARVAHVQPGGHFRDLVGRRGRKWAIGEEKEGGRLAQVRCLKKRKNPQNVSATAMDSI